MSASKPFKEFLDRALVDDLTRRIAQVWPAFPVEEFRSRVVPTLEAFELKGRSA